MTTSKGGRKATGSIRVLRHKLTGEKCWHGRFTFADGTRTKFRPLDRDPPIALDDRAGAKEYASKIAEIIVRDGIVPDSVRETVAEYAGRWLDDREGRVNSIRDDRSRLRDHVLPMLGLLDVRTFTRDDVEAVRDALDRKIVRGELAWKTVGSCWTLVTSMCADMMSAKRREFRVRDDNPARDVKPPERGARKAKQYLYPSEFLTFVTCEKVPLRWRRAVALAIYTTTRDAELRVLRWEDVNHGVIDITRAFNRRKPGEVKGTKSGHTRRFAAEPELLPLLATMRAETGGNGLVVALPSERAMARNLRRWLAKAGVTRAALHKGSKTSKQITWHDLRATGATWMAVRGDDPLKIKQRCGHTTFSTTEIYIREAEAVREGFGDVFPALPECLVQPRGVLAQFRPGPEPEAQSSLKQGVSSGVDGTRTRGENTQETPCFEAFPETADDPPVRNEREFASIGVQYRSLTSVGSEPSSDSELERAIVDAVTMGLGDVAKTLAGRLEERRRERAGNVVPIRSRG